MTSQEIVAQLPFQQAHPLQIAPKLRELQAMGVVHRVRTMVGDPAWLITGHAEVQRLFDDDRLGMTHPRPGTAARMGKSALYGGPLGDFARDHAYHAWCRALWQPHFTPKQVRALVPQVETFTTELLDKLEAQGSPADLQTAVALPLPILVICALLGVPYADRDDFRARIIEASDTRDSARSERGLTGLMAYMKQLIALKRREPGADVISQYCATDGLSDDQIAGLSTGLLWAGHETTAVEIGLGAVILLAEPQRWRALADDPSVVPSAIEEILRVSRRGTGVLPRYARTDIEFAGVTIKAGDLVLLCNASANHDASVFPDPERVDISRAPGKHLTFGYGTRYCVGAPLARLEMSTVFSQLASRFPTMRLAKNLDELVPPAGTLFGGLTEVPVRW